MVKKQNRPGKTLRRKELKNCQRMQSPLFGILPALLPKKDVYTEDVFETPHPVSRMQG